MSSLVSGLARGVNSVPHRAMPPLGEYEAWLAARKERFSNGCGGSCLSASIYRRIAQLRRMGDTWAEIARCANVTSSVHVKQAWLRLPEALR